MSSKLYSRLFQFCAGPQQMVFEACEEHRVHLETGPTSFIVIKSAPIIEQTIPEDAKNHCQWCREG
jgi:hypothetical protein